MNTIVTLADIPPHIPSDRIVDFDIYDPPLRKSDIYDGWANLMGDEVPDLVWTPRNEGHWLPTRSSLVLEILEDHENFSNNNVIIPKSHGDSYKVIPGYFDPPEHTPYRLALNAALSPRIVKGIEGKIRSIAGDLAENLKRRGECEFVSEFAEILPITMFMSLMELPMEDVPRTKFWANQMFRPDGSIGFDEALDKLTDYMAGHVDRRMGGDGTDMLSQLINSKINGKPLSRYDAVQIATQVVIAGLDTVVSFLGFVFRYLATHPELRRQLASDLALVPRAVDEFVRRFPIVTIGRLVRHDMNFHGVQLKAGEMMAIPTMIAASDESFNEDPRQVRVERISRNILTFGAGPHLCPGRHLARAEISVTLQEWLKRIPEFTMRPGEGPDYRAGVVTTIPSLHLVWPAKAEA
ncbi:MAG: cytochrome P450 [Novosphingobium sp.]